VEAGADRITEPPEQNVVGPPGVIVGVAGTLFTVIEPVAVDVPHPPVNVTV
jgi:hypothetical protein